MNRSTPTTIGCLTPSVLLAATFFAATTLFLSWVTLTDSPAHVADQIWGAIGGAVVLTVLTSCGGALWFLTRAKFAALRIAALAAYLAVGLNAVQLLAGFGIVGDAYRRGGDWGALAVAAAWVVGVFYSLLTCLVNVALAARLHHLLRDARQAVSGGVRSEAPLTQSRDSHHPLP